MAANKALDTLCAAAGGGPAADAALALLSKLFGNIVAHPEDPKYRRLKTDNAKLNDVLFRHTGAKEFLLAVGFSQASDGSFEFSQSAVNILRDAIALVARHGSSPAAAAAGEDRLLKSYHEALEGGARGVGVAEAEAVAAQPGGIDALQCLEKVLVNIRRYPDSERYRCVNLAKPASRKVLQAVELLRLAGFREGKLSGGEDCMTLARANIDVIERIWAISLWSCVPMPLLEPTVPVPGSTLDHALGALLGAAIGDALGAPLGGRGPFEVSALELDKATEMCGGGRWSVAPGQPTGNTELLVCLAEALAEAGAGAARGPPPLEDLAARYGKWGQSQPFRGERACRQAFQRPLPADTMTERARDANQKSLGAGALNRCLPAAVLCAAQGTPNAAAALARADAALSHPDATVGCAVATYAAGAAHLIAAAGDRRVALDELQALLKREADAGRSGKAPMQGGQGPGGWTHLPGSGEQKPDAGDSDSKPWTPPGTDVVALEVVSGWLKDALASDTQLPFSDESSAALLDHEVGSVQIPLAHAFRHLHRGTGFEKAMRAVLAGGGDACATAAAVGGLLGAAEGVRGLPPRWVKAVLCCDVNLGQFRPPEYAAKNLPPLAARLCAVTR